MVRSLTFRLQGDEYNAPKDIRLGAFTFQLSAKTITFQPRNSNSKRIIN